MSEPLKPCPHCGGGAVMSADMTAFPQVSCDACGASVSGRGVDGAAENWNRRTPDVDSVLEKVAVEINRAWMNCSDPDESYGLEQAAAIVRSHKEAK